MCDADNNEVGVKDTEAHEEDESAASQDSKSAASTDSGNQQPEAETVTGGSPLLDQIQKLRQSQFMLKTQKKALAKDMKTQ